MAASPGAKEPIPRELMDILACPSCKARLRYNVTRRGLICTKCRASYPIKDGIPILIPK